MLAWRSRRAITPTLPEHPQKGLRTALAGVDRAENHRPVALSERPHLLKIAERIGPGQKLCNVRASDRAVATWEIPEVFGPTNRRQRTVLEAVRRLRRRDRQRDCGDADPVPVAAVARFLGEPVASHVHRLMQIAGRSAQRLKWSGKEQILMLSSGNISIFLSICHEIWEAFLRAERRKAPRDQRDPIAEGIHPDVEAVGIRTASKYWCDKVTEQPNGDDRQRFIDVLGAQFRAWLLDDDSMSYPGHNGFSVPVDELAQNPTLAVFLDEAVSYGDLVAVEHTTKERDRRRRRKWYLNPVLSDYFQIPESHAKEPRYVGVEEVVGWLRRAEVVLPGMNNGKRPRSGETRDAGEHPEQPFLFGPLNEGAR